MKRRPTSFVHHEIRCERDALERFARVVALYVQEPDGQFWRVVEALADLPEAIRARLVLPVNTERS